MARLFQHVKKKNLNLSLFYQVVLVSILLFLISLAFSFSDSFAVHLKMETRVVAITDFFTSLAVLILAVYRNKEKIQNMKKNSFLYSDIINKNSFFRFIILLLAVYFFYKAVISYQLILHGARREDLIFNYRTTDGLFILFANSIVIYLFSFIIVFPLKKDMAILILFSFFLSLVVAASRSQILVVIFLSSIYFVFSNKKVNVFKIAIIILFFLYVSYLITAYLQRRRITSGLGMITKLSDTLFYYRAYSFYLAEYVISVIDTEKIMYPFFGYAIEKISSIIAPSARLQIDSAFVTNYHMLGYSGAPMLANVLYPWWAWFFGIFGIFGIFIKNLFLFLFVNLFLNKELFFLSVWMLYVILFLSPIKHPFLTSGDTVFFLAAFGMDFFFTSKIKNLRSRV